MFRSRDIFIALVLSAGYLAVAFGLEYAVHANVVGAQVAVRATQVIVGLALVTYANFMPKMLGDFRSPARAIWMQSVLRTGGRAFMIGGLGYAIASALPVPAVVAIAILGTATAYVLGYIVLACSPWPRRHDRAV